MTLSIAKSQYKQAIAARDAGQYLQAAQLAFSSQQAAMRSRSTSASTLDLAFASHVVASLAASKLLEGPPACTYERSTAGVIKQHSRLVGWSK